MNISKLVYLGFRMSLQDPLEKKGINIDFTNDIIVTRCNYDNSRKYLKVQRSIPSDISQHNPIFTTVILHYLGITVLEIVNEYKMACKFLTDKELEDILLNVNDF